MITYVTSYYDIGRENWEEFGRKNSEYINAFDNIISLFEKNSDEKLITFIDEKYFDLINKKIEHINNIKLIKLNENFLNKFTVWKTIDKEREIMNSDTFKKIVGQRIKYPEHTYPEYTLINHCKIDFICYLIDFNLTNTEYFSWFDFGYFSNKLNLPEKLLDLYKLDIEKINFNLINPIEGITKNVYYHLMYAPEIVGGGAFFGRKDKLKEYQNLYHNILFTFQNNINITDDDQHIILQCYFLNNNLIKFHKKYGWFEFFKSNQKT